jgi:hypothetical protein
MAGRPVDAFKLQLQVKFLRKPDPERKDDNKSLTRRKVASMGNNFKRYGRPLELFDRNKRLSFPDGRSFLVPPVGLEVSGFSAGSA